MRTILHSDCNGFFASVECLYNPSLKNKPVVVGGDAEKRHGIILAKNEIAKKYKISTGEPIWKALKKCPELEVVPPHYDRYLRLSKLCREIYYEYTDKIEPFGLDEAWLDVTGSYLLFGDGEKIAHEIRKRIKRELGITVSIGVSFNKIFAKLGSDYKKPDAVTVISKENFKEIAWKLPASDLLYVGKSTDTKLKGLGIFTIGDLANYPLTLLRSNFGKWGDLLYSFSNGYDSSEVSNYEETDPVKSIGNATTTIRDIENFEDAKIIFMILTDSVARRLREQGLYCKEVSISIRDTKLNTITRQTKLGRYTNLTNDILKSSLSLFKNNHDFSINVRTLGVTVSDLKNDSISTQVSIFEDETKRDRLQNLDSACDILKERFGCYCIRPAKVMFDPILSGFSPKEEHVAHPVSYFK